MTGSFMLIKIKWDSTGGKTCHVKADMSENDDEAFHFKDCK